MRFIFDNKEMMSKLMFAKEVVASKNAMSILSNILMVLNNGVLEIRCVDQATAMMTTIEVDSQEDGRAVVYLDKMISIVSSLPSGLVEFIAEQGQILFRPMNSKKVSFKLKCLSDNQYPLIPSLDVTDLNWQSLPAKDLKRLLSCTINSVSTDDTRYFLCGVFLEEIECKLNAVGTDGNMLSMCTAELTSPLNFNNDNIIVPTKALSIVIKKFSDDGQIDIALNENNIYFRKDGVTLTTVLRDGKYPNYKRVIPENQQNYMDIPRDELLETLARVGQMADSKFKKCVFTISESTLKVDTTSSELGNATEEIDVKANGKPMQIHFNIDKLLLALKSCDAETVRFEYTDSLKPITISEQPYGNRFHVVMPLRSV